MSTATVIPFAQKSRESTTAMERYQDAYQVARTTVGLAETIKLGGTFLAGVIFICALVAFLLNPAGRFAFPVVSAWLIAGAVLVVLVSHLWSMVFRVQGWMLEIAIDSAVNSSPLLSSTQRARVISWPNEAASVGSEQQSAV
jgi:hypothetical protein